MEAIFVLGSSDTRVAERAADLFIQGYGDYIICSGGYGKTPTFIKPEAEAFKDTIISKGVPEEKILTESRSTNTGENILFTQKLLEEKNLYPTSFILVQKPYMERRTYATFKKQWFGIDCIVTSPLLSYEEYCSKDSNFKEKFINLMVGDLLRIREYPKLGFQIEQVIPDDVWDAGQKLLVLGYNKFAL